MSLENLISISFAQDELDSIDTHIGEIAKIIKGKTINLTPDERKQYGRIANQNKLLVDKAKHYMEQYPDFVPRFVDKAEFDRDYAAREQVESRLLALENLTQQLSDTKTLLDHDNYNNTLSFYRMMRYLAGENEAGAKQIYEDMKQLFRKSSRDKVSTIATEDKMS